MSETVSSDESKTVEEVSRSENDEPPEKPLLKSILKRERNHPNKKVDFNLQVECIPFDPSKDYTVEIKIVEKIVHIKSWAAIMEQRRREAEEAAKAVVSGRDTDDNEDNEPLSTDLSKKILKRQSSPSRGKKKSVKPPAKSDPSGVKITNNTPAIVVDS